MSGPKDFSQKELYALNEVDHEAVVLLCDLVKRYQVFEHLHILVFQK